MAKEQKAAEKITLVKGFEELIFRTLREVLETLTNENEEQLYSIIFNISQLLPSTSFTTDHVYSLIGILKKIKGEGVTISM